jgi:serine/threonine protein kinase
MPLALHDTSTARWAPVPPELGSDIASLERFQREARAASALNHPRICTIHEIGKQDNQYFIVTKLLEGKTLRDSIVGKAFALGSNTGIGDRSSFSRSIWTQFTSPLNSLLLGP